jgi:hypothetical protein
MSRPPVDALASGAVVTVRSADVERRIVAHDNIPAGHKIAVRALAAGVRVRKYGECIGPPDMRGRRRRVGARSQSRVDGRARCARRRRVAGSGDVDVEPVGTCAPTSAAASYSTRRTSASGGSTPRQAPALHGLHLSSGRHRAWTMREGISSVALAFGHRLVVTTRAAVRLYDPVTVRSRRSPMPAESLHDHDFGPAIADARGRLWCAARTVRIVGSARQACSGSTRTAS